MKSSTDTRGEGSGLGLLTKVLGVVLLPVIWHCLKTYVGVSDRYLPSIMSVIRSFQDIEPNVFVHLGYTVSRFGFGFILGVGAGIGLGLLIFRFLWFRNLIMPTIQASRAIPAIAIVPFFLLWFGFSELGRYLLVVAGTAFNVAVAALQILGSGPEKYGIMFQSFGRKPEELLFDYGLPLIMERILPTLRFSLSAAIGLIVASELLGSQVGLGYLIQTSRSTFSMHVVFLAAILLGVLNATADGLLQITWRKLVWWRQ